MTFPIINDYRQALKNADKRFASLTVTPILDGAGEPEFMAGNFAAVFKAHVNPGDQLVAIKLFTRDLPQLEMRQKTTSKVIETLGARYLIDIGFMGKEIFVTSKIAGNGEFPLVVMPWVEGKSLGAVIEKLCSNQNSKALFALSKAWANLAQHMLANKIAHGDLKHDNILVTPEGQLRLLDYDSMYVPQLKGLDCVLVGGASYQHPRRTIKHFSPSLDHFSILVIALSLRALCVDPSLLAPFNTGENIIFTQEDFLAPQNSQLIQRLMASPDKIVRAWTQLLAKVAMSKSLEVPRLTRVLKDARKEPATTLQAKQDTAFVNSGLQVMA
ncbi:protein kinase [Magnetovibrio sp. PR-2]|uniref:protein kinase domain-containing protein n=1 Tax=Magnetovibrio sp. PR-2 TaxID=3120356 RepID=UPI002FCE07CD